MFPPANPVTIQNTIPSYLYSKYTDDDDLQAFVAAYNTLTQEYVTLFNGLNLPDYRQLSAPLLDWVGQGLYGLVRPTLASGLAGPLGPFNTLTLNSEPFNFFLPSPDDPPADTTDDIYKRMLTWAFFKGDRRQFDTRWLKRRIVRFILGVDGYDIGTEDTYDVSVQVSGTTVTITITGDLASNPAAEIFAEAVATGAVELPFQYSYSVVI